MNKYDINEIKTRLNIVDIVSSRIKLKKSGKNYFACCPFHHEKSPSFSVTEEKQIYYCFGCGAGGDVIDFVMQYDSVSFQDAAGRLAEIANVTTTEDRNFFIPANLKDKYQADRFFIAIYEADVKKGKDIKLADKKRYRLALARKKGFEDKYINHKKQEVRI